MFDPSKPVQVYRNLHKDCWSLRQGGRVVAHRAVLALRDVTMAVQPAGQRAVRETGRKRVHAYLKGFLAEPRPKEANGELVRLHYDPYRHEGFVAESSPRPVRRASYALLDPSGAWVLAPERRIPAEYAQEAP